MEAYMIKSEKTSYKKKSLFLTMFFMMILAMLFISKEVARANDKNIYSDGIYRYLISNEKDKEVQLIGVEAIEEMDELFIPGTVTINEKEYTVDRVNFYWNYTENEDYAAFYNSVKKINIADNFTGSISGLTYDFPNLKYIEFYGSSTPKEVSISIGNRSIRDILFIVPKGSESEYSKVIDFSINYYMSSDLYEHDIILTPTIVTKVTDDIEYGYFANDGYIYKVIESAKNGNGKVELVGITDYLRRGYIALKGKVKNNGYTYKLTALGRFSLIGSGASVIAVPDTVTDMANAVFDSRVEILFLSKNCKVIPHLIADENDETNLRFVYVPEGVRTISDYAFNNIPNNTASIILPTTIEQVGKKSLYAFKLVTFLNKKPLDNIKSAINNGTTVKVHESAISNFKKNLGSKYTVQAAKNIVKAKNITLNKESLNISTIKTTTITAKLTKGSNENVYWLSTNPEIVEVSSKGIINPRKAGTAYVIAYTRTSGRHKVIKITVSDTTFDDGIFTYRITNPSKKTVSLCQVRPTKSLKTLTIPETVKYKNVKYTVTGVIANPEDTSIPLIPNDYSNNKIKKIIFSKTISGILGYLGELKHIENITFKGKNPPDEIRDWYLDDGLLAWQAVIYVPKGSVNAYTTSLWMRWGYDTTYEGIHYDCLMDFNIVESGNNQVQRFVVDGVLYRVAKYAGKQNGKVVVKGIDVNLKKVKINKTVSYNGYTYEVTEINKSALRNSKNIEIIIDKSITKRNTGEKYNAPVNYVV